MTPKEYDFHQSCSVPNYQMISGNVLILKELEAFMIYAIRWKLDINMLKENSLIDTKI